MKLCYVSFDYPSDGAGGGIGTYTRIVAEQMVRRGHQVWVISHHVNGLPEHYEEKGIRVVRILPSSLHYYVSKIAPVRTKIALAIRLVEFAWRANREVRALFKHEGIDLVEYAVNQGESFFHHWFRKRPFSVVRLHGPRFAIPEPVDVTRQIHIRVQNWMEKQACLHADILTSPSQFVADLTRQKYALPDSRVRVIYNPVNLSLFQPAVQQKKPPKPIIFLAGRLDDPQKGGKTLVQAIPGVLEAFPQAVFRFAGAGSSWLSQETPAPLHSQMEFCGHLSPAELARQYVQVDVCVVPSLWEPFGYACVEAMACAKPVVASRVWAIPEIVEDGVTGMLVPAGDPQALSEAIIQLLQNPELAQTMGQRGRFKVKEKFSTENIIDQIEFLYHDLCSKKQ